MSCVGSELFLVSSASLALIRLARSRIERAGRTYSFGIEAHLMRSSMLRDDGLGQVMLPRGYGVRAKVGAETGVGGLLFDLFIS